MSDALIALLVIGALFLIFWLAGLHGWAWLWLAIAGVVGIAELWAKLATGKTLSQRFWAYRKEHPVRAWMLIGVLTLAWVGLLVHLTWK